MDITEAIAQVEGDLAHTMQELTMTRELLNELEQGRKKLELELHGLRSFAQRAGEDELSATPRRTASSDGGAEVVPISGMPTLQLAVASNHGLGGQSLGTMSRTDAVLTILRAATSPIDRAAIHEQLYDGGREEDTVDDVSLTLSGLKRSKRVERLGKGLWQVVASPTPRTSLSSDHLRSIEN